MTRLTASESRTATTAVAATTRILAIRSRERCGIAINVGWMVPCRYSWPVAKMPMIVMKTGTKGIANEPPPVRTLPTVTALIASSSLRVAMAMINATAAERRIPSPISQ
jgi:hypothetical protein